MQNVVLRLPGNFPEIAEGEVKDFILDLVSKQLQQIPEQLICRRKDLCNAVLSSNQKTGCLDEVKSDLLKTITSVDAKRLSYEKNGFHIERNRHLKLKWNDKYPVIIPCTASDRRYIQNLLHDVATKFF